MHLHIKYPPKLADVGLGPTTLTITSRTVTKLPTLRVESGETIKECHFLRRLIADDFAMPSWELRTALR